MSQQTEPTWTPQDQEEKLTDHVYDGIQEYDNPLPGWWKFLFWMSILFAPIYLFYFHAGPESRSIYGQYEAEKSASYEKRFSTLGDLTPDRETIMRFVDKDRDWLTVGESIFKSNCVACHNSDGSGAVGPNLTDDYWLHVHNVEDIAKVISDGAANGAMPAWKNRLTHPAQIVLTAAYVASLRENPKPGRAPEGEKIGPWKKK